MARKNCDNTLFTLAENLSTRFSWLKTIHAPSDSANESSQLQLVAALDAIRPPYSFTHLTSMLLSIKLRIQEIITLSLSWAASTFRSGRHRCYIVTGLIRELLSRSGDTHTSVLASLSELEGNNHVDSRGVSQIVAELIISKHFDFARYLRWLIASGTFSGRSRNEHVSRLAHSGHQ